MTEADVFQDALTGAMMIRMRPVDWEESHEEQVFTDCPKERTHVSVAAFCSLCPHFKGLSVPKVGRLLARLNKEEITADQFSKRSAEALQQASSVQVSCAYPTLRHCGSFKAVRNDAGTVSS